MVMHTKQKMQFLVFMLSILNLFSCGSDDKETAESATLNFARVYNEVMSSSGTGLNCKQCHSAGGTAELEASVTLKLDSAASAESSFKDRTAHSQSTPDCNGAKYVDPGNPSGSYLFAVMGGSGFNGLSGCTPTNRHYAGDINLQIQPSQLALIGDWITAGAP